MIFKIAIKFIWMALMAYCVYVIVRGGYGVEALGIVISALYIGGADNGTDKRKL